MTGDETDVRAAVLRRLVADMVASYVSANQLAWTELPQFIQSVYAALADLDGQGSARTVEARPAIPVKQSIADDAVICLDCGVPFAMLRRHLREAHGLGPAEYREKWKLPGNYPLVAPAYSRKRSDVAKTMGLGRRPEAPRRRERRT